MDGKEKGMTNLCEMPNLFVAYAITQIKKQSIQILLLFAITTESIANQQHDFRIKRSELYKLSLEGIADKVSLPTDLIAINGDKNPQLMYFAHRKGWTIASDKVGDSVFMNEIISSGCKFLFMDKHSFSDKDMISNKNWDIVFNNEHFVVYSLRK